MTRSAKLSVNVDEGTELQISLTPTDLPHARWIVPHQLRQWAAQVDSIQLTIDLGKNPATGVRQGTAYLRMKAFLDELCGAFPHSRVVEVDYSPPTFRALADRYFDGRRDVPAMCFYGAFYAYFFGVFATPRRFVLHMDSDMLYGGGSDSWVREAVELMSRRPDVLACNPLPGPPTPDGGLRSQKLERDSEGDSSFRVRALSTRLFLLDTQRLASITPIPLLHVGRGRELQARIEGRSPVLPAETCISAAMQRRGMWRVDFLGRPPGMWSIHPPYRSAAFYKTLPDVVRRVEEGAIPEAQRGRHDVDDALVDWSDVRPTLRLRLERHAGIFAQRLAARVRGGRQPVADFRSTSDPDD